MEKVTGGPPESPTRRAATIARVGARYGFGFVFGGRLSRRRGPADTGRVGPAAPAPPGAARPAPRARAPPPPAPAAPGRLGPRLLLSLEELGPTFAEFGRFLSARGDLIPPDVAAELARAAGPAPPAPLAAAARGGPPPPRAAPPPPALAAELAPPAAPATPVPFAEARAVLERELDNT